MGTREEEEEEEEEKTTRVLQPHRLLAIWKQRLSDLHNCNGMYEACPYQLLPPLFSSTLEEQEGVKKIKQEGNGLFDLRAQ